MTTVPAHNFSAPARAWVIAAARFMPGVWAVLVSSSLERTTRTPSRRHRAWLRSSMAALRPGFRAWRARSMCALAIYRQTMLPNSGRRIAGAAAGGGARTALNWLHDRALARDGSYAPDCARAHRRRAHRHRRARAARHDLFAAACLPRRRTGHGGAVSLRGRRDGRLDPARGRGPAGEASIARERGPGARRRRDGGARNRARGRRAKVIE